MILGDSKQRDALFKYNLGDLWKFFASLLQASWAGLREPDSHCTIWAISDERWAIVEGVAIVAQKWWWLTSQ